VSAADEIVAIVDTLWFLPPPARVPIAEGLHGLGVRVHPELATSVMVTDDTPGMGNHAPRAPLAKRALDFLEQSNPDLAAKITAAQADPQAKHRLAAQLREQIGADIPALREQVDVSVAEFDQ
jgi:hypothetical protein